MYVRKIFAILSGRGLSLRVALNLIERSRDDFLLALGDLLLLIVGATTARAATRFLRLRIFELERNGLHEDHVRLLRILAVTRRRIKADDVARHQLEVFHRKERGAFYLLCALVLQHRYNLLRIAVHGVVQIELLQRKFILTGHRDTDFFDRTNFGIPSWLGNAHFRHPDLAGLNEVIVGKPDQFAVVHHRDVVRAVFFNRDGRWSNVIARTGEVHSLAVFENNLRVAESFVGANFQLRNRALNRPQIAARILRHSNQASPRRIVITNANVLDRRQIDRMQLKRRRSQPACFYVILSVFRKGRKHETKSGSAGFRLHWRFFPLRRTGVLNENIGLRSKESAEFRADHHIGFAPHRLVAGLHRNAVERLGSRVLRIAAP